MALAGFIEILPILHALSTFEIPEDKWYRNILEMIFLRDCIF